jgi:hypothetical protein
MDEITTRAALLEALRNGAILKLEKFGTWKVIFAEHRSPERISGAQFRDISDEVERIDDGRKVIGQEWALRKEPRKPKLGFAAETAIKRTFSDRLFYLVARRVDRGISASIEREIEDLLNITAREAVQGFDVSFVKARRMLVDFLVGEATRGEILFGTTIVALKAEALARRNG